MKYVYLSVTVFFLICLAGVQFFVQNYRTLRCDQLGAARIHELVRVRECEPDAATIRLVGRVSTVASIPLFDNGADDERALRVELRATDVPWSLYRLPSGYAERAALRYARPFFARVTGNEAGLIELERAEEPADLKLWFSVGLGVAAFLFFLMAAVTIRDDRREDFDDAPKPSGF